MFRKQKKKKVVFFILCCELGGSSLLSCWPEKTNKKKNHTHEYTSEIKIPRQSSLNASLEFLGAVRSITNVKQANVKMLLSALAPCVYRISGIRFFYKQVEPHVP